MNILNFLLNNWDSVLLLFVLIAVIIYIIAKKQYKILDKIAYFCVNEAEQLYGGGTGSVKLAAAVDWLYPKIPKLIRLFLTADQIEKIIETALITAKKHWDENPRLLNYINNNKM
jgi:hypothetical protein